MPGKKKKKQGMTLSEAHRKRLERGYRQDYMSRRFKEAGGGAALAPKDKWMQIHKDNPKYKP